MKMLLNIYEHIFSSVCNAYVYAYLYQTHIIFQILNAEKFGFLQIILQSYTVDGQQKEIMTLPFPEVTMTNDNGLACLVKTPANSMWYPPSNEFILLNAFFIQNLLFCIKLFFKLFLNVMEEQSVSNPGNLFQFEMKIYWNLHISW